MSFEIEIQEGHDDGACYWFRPVIFKKNDKVDYDDVVELEEEFSIQEDDISCFLSYFFFKYYDAELIYNKKRYDACDEFEWYLTHNFFTYESLYKMVYEIFSVSDMLNNDYNNPKLNDIKKNFSIYYMTSIDDIDHDNEYAIEKHISVVIDFYKRFTKRIIKMMENNKNTNIISIMGP